MSRNLIPRSSALYKFLKEKTPDWRHVIGLLNSPIFRAVAFLPIIGYFILYTDTFRAFLSTHGLDSGWILSVNQRLSLVYSGGVSLLAAYAVYRTTCPPMIRESNSLELYLDRQKTTGSVRDVLYVIEQAAREPDIFGPYSEKTEKFTLRVSQYINRLQQTAEVDEELWKKKELLLSGIQSETGLSDEQYLTIADFEAQLYHAAVTMHDDPWLQIYGTDIHALFYVENSRLPVLSRVWALVAVWTGYLSILIPAVEAYIQISWLS
jgi:hypothetical protein